MDYLDGSFSHTNPALQSIINAAIQNGSLTNRPCSEEEACTHVNCIHKGEIYRRILRRAVREPDWSGEVLKQNGLDYF